jgi:NAD dependent epimerase/dehydratase
MAGWIGRRVLVTGAGGFIGSHLTERLVQAGAAVRVLLRYTSTASRGWLDGSPAGESIEVFAGDLCDRDVLTRALRGVDVVFHLAALIGIPYSYDAPASYVRTNVEGTLAILQTATAAGVRRVVHTSTSEVYGTARRVPIDEDHPLQPQSPYAASKAAADLMAAAFHKSYGLEVVTMRPFNTYGPRQSLRAVIPTIISQAVAGPVIKLGHLAPTRDFTYVSDTADAFMAIGTAEDVAGQVVNVGSGKEIAIADLVSLIQSITGTSRPVVPDEIRERPPSSEVDRLCADTSRAQALLGWTPRVTLREGLLRTVEWIVEHRERYRTSDYRV